MSQVADVTLKIFGRFARAQWEIDQLADRGSSQDQALRDALSAGGRWRPDQAIRSWERKNQKQLHQMQKTGWFRLDSWHASVLASKLADDTRPPYFTVFCERELGDAGKHREFSGAYEEVRRLRNFLAHNMALNVHPGTEYLAVGWFHTEAFGPWLEEDKRRLDLAFMTSALEVAVWLVDVVVWTRWKLGHVKDARDTDDVLFSTSHEPSATPPQLLGVPLLEPDEDDTGSED